MYKPAIISITLILISSLVFGLDHYPFPDDYQGVQPPYHVDIEKNFLINGTKVNEGDRLILETGEVLFFKRILDKSTNTIIFEDSSGRAIRMNIDYRKEGKRLTFKAYKSSMLLVNQYLPRRFSTEVLSDQLRSENVLIVEKIDISILAVDFLSSAQFSREDPRYMSFINFVNSFRVFSIIDDFHPYQIGWVENRGWVLFDVGVRVDLSSDQISISTRQLTHEWEYHIPKNVFDELTNDLNNNLKPSDISITQVQCRSVL